MRRRPILLVLPAAALLAWGCARDATTPADASLDSADAALLAEEFAVLGQFVLDGELALLGRFAELPAGAAPIPVDRSFTRTAACPRGGSVTVSGRTTGELDREARSLTLETNATKTQAACAFPTRRGAGVVLTVNGAPNLAIRATQKIVAGQPSGPQTLTQKGGFTWQASDGRSGACQVDIASVMDPAARTLTVKGTMCGRTVDVVRQLPNRR